MSTNAIKSAGSLLLKTLGGALDLVYPPHCLVCELHGEPQICESCHALFASIPDPVCKVCGRPVLEGVPCRTCDEATGTWGGWGFDGCRAAGIYDGALRHALHRLKYRRIEALGEPLGAYLANRIVGDNSFGGDGLCDVAAVIPVPSLPLRERWRGFNQSSLLAAPVAEQLGVPQLTEVVRRERRAANGSAVVAQVGLSGTLRRANITPEHFTVIDVRGIRGKTVLVIDDVFTTGSTLSACAAALKNAGASRVLAASLASGG